MPKITFCAEGPPPHLQTNIGSISFRNERLGAKKPKTFSTFAPVQMNTLYNYL